MKARTAGRRKNVEGCQTLASGLEREHSEFPDSFPGYGSAEPLIPIASASPRGSTRRVIADQHGRVLRCLRISITDRCNLRCRYCNPSGVVERIPSDLLLTDDELLRVVGVAARCGVDKFRLTGGEPLLRPGVVELVRGIGALEGVKQIAMTTNGTRLAPLADELARAGLKRVNISLDTLRPEKFREITRGGALQAVHTGIARSVAAGLTPVKLNVVLVPGFSEPEIIPLARLTLHSSVHVRFCELVHCGKDPLDQEKARLSGAMALDLIEAELGGLRKISPADKESVASLYRLPGAKGLVGIVDAACGRLCSSCTRMRLTAGGTLRPCLFDDTEIDIRTPLRSGATDDDIEAILREAAAAKRNPASPLTADVNAPMNIIGG